MSKGFFSFFFSQRKERSTWSEVFFFFSFSLSRISRKQLLSRFYSQCYCKGKKALETKLPPINRLAPVSLPWVRTHEVRKTSSPWNKLTWTKVHVVINVFFNKSHNVSPEKRCVTTQITTMLRITKISLTGFEISFRYFPSPFNLEYGN